MKYLCTYEELEYQISDYVECTEDDNFYKWYKPKKLNVVVDTMNREDL